MCNGLLTGVSPEVIAASGIHPKVLDAVNSGDLSCLHPDLVPMVTAGDGYYDTATLMEVLMHPMNQPPTGFWLQWFDRVVTFETEKIMFDELDPNEYRLAPFVAPNVAGRAIRSKGYDTKSFKPAYLKPKHVVDPSRAIPRMPGEQPLGAMTRQQRFDAVLADNLRREREMIQNRIDWMACQAIVSGSVVVAGDDYPEVTVDFGRDASLTSVLAGAAKWDQTTATPIADIQAMRRKAYLLGGSPVNTLIFGLDAWSAFLDDHADVKQLLNILTRGNESVFNLSNIDDGSSYNFEGFLQGNGGLGRIAMWTYARFYEGDDGIGVPYFDSSTVVGIGSATSGVRCHGAIMDRRAGLQPMEMFPKSWDEEDPSVTYTMTQSAPLPVVMRPNNTFSMKVV